MPIETHVFAAGAYRKAKEVYVKDGGVWRDLKEIWINDQGVWRKVFTKFFEYNADISGFNFNLRDAVVATGQWDGVTPVLANLRVVGNLGSNPPQPNPGGGDNPNTYVTRRNIMNNYPNYPAFDSGSLPAYSEINLTVMPGVYLVGGGGAAGSAYSTNPRSHSNPDGQYYFYVCEDGGPGTPAIKTSVLTRITNNGVIGGGGGGGAGGLGPYAAQYWQGVQFNSFSVGGNGGSGAGYTPGPLENTFTSSNSGTAGFGQSGTITTGGNGGQPSSVGGARLGTPGGRGGDLGQAGGVGGSQLSGDPANLRRVGGAPGAAVIGSSFVEWQAYGDVRGPLA